MLRIVAALCFVCGVAILGAAPAALAQATLSVSPDSGLTGGQSVTVTGSGFAKSSIGNILECNNAPNEPTVALGSPVSSNVPVGCTGPSLTQLVTTNSSGDVSSSYKVSMGTIGPPCGASGDIITKCPSTDSAGLSPSADAANFPCPPTAAQLAAGVTCQLSYGDEAGDSASANIAFTGGTTSSSTSTTTTTTGSSTTSTTSAGSTSTTTTTTSAPTTTSTTAIATPTTTATTSSTPVSTQPPSTSASSSSLAFTGAGLPLWLVMLAGALLVLFGVGIWLFGYMGAKSLRLNPAEKEPTSRRRR